MRVAKRQRYRVELRGGAKRNPSMQRRTAVSAAWSLLPSEARNVFRAALGADDATWNRARGLALVVVLQALPYYLHTNPSFAGIARYTISEVLSDHRWES